MSFISEIPPERAEGELAELYQRIAGARGGVAGVMTCHSLNPAAMAGHFDLYKTIMFGSSPLSRKLREMIGVVVSANNDCQYCVAHHRQPLERYRVPSDTLDALVAGDFSMLDDKTSAILRYAESQTRDPCANERRIEDLRAVGWGDRAILDATLIISYFNFVNRVVLGLGVELEDGFEATCRTDISV